MIEDRFLTRQVQYFSESDAAEDLGNEYPHINCSVVFVSSDESESGNAN